MIASGISNGALYETFPLDLSTVFMAASMPVPWGGKVNRGVWSFCLATTYMFVVKYGNWLTDPMCKLLSHVIQVCNLQSVPRLHQVRAEVSAWQKNIHDIGTVLNRFRKRAGAVKPGTPDMVPFMFTSPTVPLIL